METSFGLRACQACQIDAAYQSLGKKKPVHRRDELAKGYLILG